MAEVVWKDGLPSLDRINEGWMRHRKAGYELLAPYKVRSYGKRLVLFIAEDSGWWRVGIGFHCLVIQHVEMPPVPEVKITSVVMDPRFLRAGAELMARIREEQEEWGQIDG